MKEWKPKAVMEMEEGKEKGELYALEEKVRQLQMVLVKSPRGRLPNAPLITW